MSHYSLEDAHHYRAHHEKNLRTRVSTMLEARLLRKALVRLGGTATVLDVPCGTGRFWSAFRQAGVQRIIGGDNSDGMLTVAAEATQGFDIAIELHKTSVFSLDFASASIEVVCCLRFFHHLAHTKDRVCALAELERVAQRAVVLSLWVDGNLQSARRMRKDAQRPLESGFGRRRCVSASLFESECRQVGLTLDRHYDLAPGLSMWRLYVLRKA